MKVVRYSDTAQYQAPRHFKMRSLRLQGLEASDTKACWVGLSHFLPQGGAEMDATPVEKIYVVLSGEVTITAEGQTVTLGFMDSCVIAANEKRSIINNTNDIAAMLVIVQHAEN